MITKMNLNGTMCKTLTAAIAEITVTKDGSIVCPARADILTSFAAAGFFQEDTGAATEAEEPTGLTVSLPKKGFIVTTARRRGRFCSARFPATLLSVTSSRRRSSRPTTNQKAKRNAARSEEV